MVVQQAHAIYVIAAYRRRNTGGNVTYRYRCAALNTDNH